MVMNEELPVNCCLIARFWIQLMSLPSINLDDGFLSFYTAEYLF